MLPGVTVEARSDVLPGPRVDGHRGNGDYRLPALPPGSYTLTFTLSGHADRDPQGAGPARPGDARPTSTLGVAGIEETVTVTAEASLVDKDTRDASPAASPTRRSSALPVGQDYRDLQKLIPAVQYTQDHDPRPERAAAAARTTSTSSTAST